jgi:hypothetical protein
MRVSKSAILGRRSAVRETITFPFGLAGCPGHRRFRVLRDPEVPQFAVLEEEDAPEPLRFGVAEAAAVLEDAPPRPTPQEREELGLEPREEAEVYLVLEWDSGPGDAVYHAESPIFVNRRTGLGRQVVRVDTTGAARRPLFVPVREDASAQPLEAPVT